MSKHTLMMSCASQGQLDDHIGKLREVLTRLQDSGLKVNAQTSKFCTKETEHLGYALTTTGIQPGPVPSDKKLG